MPSQVRGELYGSGLQVRLEEQEVEEKSGRNRMMGGRFGCQLPEAVRAGDDEVGGEGSDVAQLQ